MKQVVSFVHMTTKFSDHCTLILEIQTNTERKGLGTFRAPLGIENDIEYQSKIRTAIKTESLKCKGLV